MEKTWIMQKLFDFKLMFAQTNPDNVPPWNCMLRYIVSELPGPCLFHRTLFLNEFAEGEHSAEGESFPKPCLKAQVSYEPVFQEPTSPT